MTKLQLSVFCLSFGLIVSGAKASDCEGAITADEALKAEDARSPPEGDSSSRMGQGRAPFAADRHQGSADRARRLWQGSGARRPLFAPAEENPPERPNGRLRASVRLGAHAPMWTLRSGGPDQRFVSQAWTIDPPPRMAGPVEMG
jgi:hypothetical protein